MCSVFDPVNGGAVQKPPRESFKVKVRKVLARLRKGKKD